MKALLLGFILLSVSGPLEALPIFRGMVASKQGMAVNCTLCHQPDSWESNAYSREFSKRGRNMKALAEMDSLDLDGDGVITSEEWKAKSNPGDPASTPARPGPWLKDVKPAFPPKKILSVLFPAGTTYRVMEEPLNAQAVLAVRKKLSRSLRDEEVFPTVFVAEKEGQTQGVATYALAPEEGGELNIVLVIVKQGRIVKLHPVHLHAKVLKTSDLLSRYAGKSAEEIRTVPPVAGAEKVSAALAESVRSAWAVLEALAF